MSQPQSLFLALQCRKKGVGSSVVVHQVRPSLAQPVAHVTVLGEPRLHHFLIQVPTIATVKAHVRRKYLGHCQTYGQPGCCSWLLALVWFIAAVWGIAQWIESFTLSFSLSVCCSAFQRRKFFKSSLFLRKV